MLKFIIIGKYKLDIRKYKNYSYGDGFDGDDEISIYDIFINMLTNKNYSLPSSHHINCDDVTQDFLQFFKNESKECLEANFLINIKKLINENYYKNNYNRKQWRICKKRNIDKIIEYAIDSTKKAVTKNFRLC